MQLEDTGIPGCFAVRARRLADNRGAFVKTFHQPTFEALGLRTDWREEFYSSSVRGVVRGMHFQTPPADHAKLVFCASGSVLDVVLDLRTGSPTWGQHRSLELSEANATGLYIPSGCAHGFLSTSDISTMYYKVTSVHAPEHDAGVLWNSFDFAWPTATPIVSDRDRSHPPLSGFTSPFRFDAGAPCR